MKPQDQSLYDPKRDREKDRGEVRPLEAVFEDFFKNMEVKDEGMESTVSVEARATQKPRMHEMI